VRLIRTLPLLAAAGVIMACNDNPMGSIDELPLFGKAKMDGPISLEGDIGPGSHYCISVPENWNGDLVLYAHGYVPPVAPLLTCEQLEGSAAPLVAAGYAVALSSYSENGFAIEDAVTRTKQLRGIFKSKVGKPDRVFLMSGSLGAAVIMHLVQQNPQHYAGALPVCGIVGGPKTELYHMYHVRILFDYFYPGVLPGTPTEVPPGLNFGTQVAPLIAAAIMADPAPAMELAAIDEVHLEYDDVMELVESIIAMISFQMSPIFIPDVLERTHGHPFFDNTELVYTGSSDDDALNAGVARLAATRDALNELERWYWPTGNLEIPVFTLHTRRDPVVPLLHEELFADIVADAGRSDFLVQRIVDEFGHCNLSPAQQVQALNDLAEWVETGVKPVP
jgi:pimeloyl-ACP methyl ester carboxylesterase